MEKKISYLNRDFEDYKNSLIEFTRKYYPDLSYHFSEASIDSWLIELNAAIADNLSYHIDRVFQETNIDSAQKPESILSIARSNGVKIPGPKGAMAEVSFVCNLPVGKVQSEDSAKNVDMSYAPLIKRGTMVSSSNQLFELLYDIDFSSQFDYFGQSDRTIIPIRDSNNNIIRYQISKLATVVAGESKIFSKNLLSRDIKPFMEIIINTGKIMNIESIIVKSGEDKFDIPEMKDFFMEDEENPQKEVTRFFEVDFLAQQERWGSSTFEGTPIKKEYSYEINGKDIPVYSITKGEWKPIRHKFITEHLPDGSIKIIFGSGMDENNEGISLKDASDFSKYQITKMLRNDNLGILPKEDSVMYILYRIGGGVSSNVPAGGINNIIYLDCEIGNKGGLNKNIISSVKGTISVTNTTPSISGKDAPTIEEMKNMIKYNNSAQERCVTIKDYKSRILKMPPQYGSPYRIGVLEENNKIMIFLLGIDYNGHLSPEMPDALLRNITSYLENYRMINDFIEIKSGKIVNLSFDINVHTNKSFNSSDVSNEIKNVIKRYMDISKHEMGDDIYVGDIFKEISKVDGVINVSSMKIYNKVGGQYSENQISQNVKSKTSESGSDATFLGKYEIDLDDSENILYSDGDTMFEIKYPDQDINILTKPI